MLALVAVAILALSGTLAWVGKDLRRGLDALYYATKREDPGDLEDRLTKAEWLIDQLPQKWEEMVKQSKRQEDRARAVVKRALDQLEEAGYDHAGVEAEATELRVRYGEPGQPNGVRPMRGSMAPTPEEASALEEDWEAATVSRKYGGGG